MTDFREDFQERFYYSALRGLLFRSGYNVMPHPSLFSFVIA
jgi:hypothetical protein